jgi:hypothetical protein
MALERDRPQREERKPVRVSRIESATLRRLESWDYKNRNVEMGRVMSKCLSHNAEQKRLH